MLYDETKQKRKKKIQVFLSKLRDEIRHRSMTDKHEYSTMYAILSNSLSVNSDKLAQHCEINSNRRATSCTTITRSAPALLLSRNTREKLNLSGVVRGGFQHLARPVNSSA